VLASVQYHFRQIILSELLSLGENVIASSSSILHFFELPSYYDYNEKTDVSWGEINSIKRIINLFGLLRNTGKTAR